MTFTNNTIGKRCTIWEQVSVYDSKIGDDVSIGAYTEVGHAIVGDRSRIGAYVFIPGGVVIEEDCFIAPKVCFTNDKYPSVEKAMTNCSAPLTTTVKRGAVIGANCTILPGITIGENAVIGGGSVVTKDVPAGEVWVGNPAKRLK